MTTVLIVDDEPDLAANLEFNLQREGYTTRCADTAAGALAISAQDPVPDLILLDLMLPDMTGTEVCKRLRAQRRTEAIPIIMRTAKGEEIDRVVGLEIGADDYVVKPFSVRELMLRVRAVLRRKQGGDVQPTAMTFGELTVELEGHRVKVSDAEIPVTALEFKLLTTLMERKGRVQTRESLLEGVWQMRSDLTTRTVDTHIKRLRQKLGVAGAYLETVRGVGYRFRDANDA